MPVRSFSQVDILLSERARLERPLVLMVCLSIVTFTLCTENMFFLLAAGAVCVIRLVAVNRNKELYVRRAWINFAVLLATALTVFELFGASSNPLATLGNYIVLIVMCKLFERSINRDLVWLVVLSLLLMVAAAMFNASIMLGVAMVVYLLGISYTAAVLTLKTGLDRAAKLHLSSESAPMSPHVVAWNVRRQWPHKSIRRCMVSLLVIMAMGGVLAFLVTPRTGFTSQWISNNGNSMSSPIRLGRNKYVRLSNEVVMRVSLDIDGKPIVPSGHLSYLRANIYTRYRKSEWQPRSESPERRLSSNPPEGATGLVRQHMYLSAKTWNGSGVMQPLATIWPVRYLDVKGAEATVTDSGVIRLTDKPPRGEWLEYVAWSQENPQVHPSPDKEGLRGKSAMDLLTSPRLVLKGVSAITAVGDHIDGIKAPMTHTTSYIPLKLFDRYSNGEWVEVDQFKDKVVTVSRRHSYRRWGGYRSRGSAPWRRGYRRPRERWSMEPFMELLPVGPNYLAMWMGVEDRAFGMASCEIPPAVSALAGRLCADLLAMHGPQASVRAPEAMMRRLQRHVMRSCQYGFEFPGVCEDRDPVEDFLFSSKTGCSEHYASAIVLMAKSLGIDVRLVGGVRIHQFGHTQRVIAPRDYHALAWVEMRTPTGWRIVDISPPRIPDAEIVEVSPLVEELAETWCEDLLVVRDNANPSLRGKYNLAIASRLKNKLQSEYTYSLDLSNSDSTRDAIEDFLFSMKRGHCEYFASAMAVMCRALDVPARLVAGYRIDGIPSQTDHLVRQRDAHAWVEVYSPQRGWVMMDPTPAGEDTGESLVWYRSIAGWWEQLQSVWYTRVVGYDEDARRALGQFVSSRIRLVWNWLVGETRDMWRGLVNLIASGEVDQAVIRLSVLLAVVGGGLEILVLIRLYHRIKGRDMYLHKVMGKRWRQAKFLLRFLKLLERRGMILNPHQTLGQIAHCAADELGLPEDKLRQIVDFYYRLRWGGYIPQHEQLVQIEAVVESLSRHASPSPDDDSKGR